MSKSFLLSIPSESTSNQPFIGLPDKSNGKAKIFYRLTNKGADLLPILVEMILWSDTYLSISPQAKEFAQMLRKNKESVIKQLFVDLQKK